MRSKKTLSILQI